MGYIFGLEEELLMLIPGLISGIPTGLFSIAAYILTAIAIYSISVRRGLSKPWLAWVPVINCWLLGSLVMAFKVSSDNSNLYLVTLG